MDNATGVLRVPLIGRCGDRRVVREWTSVEDDEFGQEIMARNWHLTGVGYAARNLPGSTNRSSAYLHRVIFDHYHGPIEKGCEVDHANRDKLDNTPSNLRAVSRGENTVNRGRQRTNTSGYIGVFFRAGKPKPWQAKVRVRGRRITLGSFTDPRQAAAAVNRAYAEHWPGVAPPNDLS